MFTHSNYSNIVEVLTLANPSLGWIKSVGGTGQDVPYGVRVDNQGNICVCGQFSNTVDFGGVILTAVSSDIFIAKYNGVGNLIWAKRFGGTGADLARYITIDSQSNIYVGGSFTGTVTFNQTYTSNGSTAGFVLKLDVNGNTLWSKAFSGQYGSGSTVDNVTAIAVASNNDVLITGQVAGWIDFGGGINYNYSLDPNTFLVRYTSTGQYIWAKEFVCGSQDYGKGLVIDNSNNIYLMGAAAGPINLGGQTLNNPGSPYSACYLAKFSSAGLHIWSKNFATLQGVNGNALSLDGNGNLLLVGTFVGACDFGNGTLQSNGQSGFLVKLDNNGISLWSKAFIARIHYLFGTSSLSVTGVTSDGNNVIITGQFWEKCDFGGGDIIGNSVGTSDGFIAKYNLINGNYVSAIKFGGNGGDWGTGIIYNNGLIIIGVTSGGDFEGQTVNSNGNYDIFVWKKV